MRTAWRMWCLASRARRSNMDCKSSHKRNVHQGSTDTSTNKKLNFASYFLWNDSNWSGSPFLCITLRVKELDGGWWMVVWQQIHSSSLIPPLLLPMSRDRSEMRLERHKDDSSSWKKIHLNRRHSFTLEHHQETFSASERVERNSSLAVEIKLLSYWVIKSQSSRVILADKIQSYI